MEDRNATAAVIGAGDWIGAASSRGATLEQLAITDGQRLALWSRGRGSEGRRQGGGLPDTHEQLPQTDWHADDMATLSRAELDTQDSPSRPIHEPAASEAMHPSAEGSHLQS